MQVPLPMLQPHADTARYAKCIQVSKRVRWDIDRDVIRDREFDFTKSSCPMACRWLIGCHS